MKEFLLAPALSLYSLPFYRRVLQSPLRRGIAYLAYLSFLLSILAVLLFSVLILPRVNGFVDWFAGRFPEVTLTRQGAQAEVPMPYRIVHQRFGPLLVIDTNKDTYVTGDADDAMFYLTRTELRFLHFQDGHEKEYRVSSLIPTQRLLAEWQDVTVTGPVIQSFYRRVRPYLLPLMFAASFLIFFTWKLLAALFYSLVALGLNLLRKDRLPYGKLLNVSFFALTAASLLQWLIYYFPTILFRITFSFSLLVTASYLALAILATQYPEEQPAGRS